MSVKTILITASAAVIHEIEKIGGTVERFVISEVQKLVGKAKTTDLGTRAMNLVSDLSNKDMSGAEKMAKLLADLKDDAEAFHANGDLAGLKVNATDFLKEFGQSVYNDFRAASAAALGETTSTATASNTGGTI